MKLSELIEGLKKFQETHGDMPVVMSDDGGSGELSDSIEFGIHTGADCNFVVVVGGCDTVENAKETATWLERLEDDTCIHKLPILLIEI